MDAVKFIEERNRMCESFGDECTGCPASNACSNACKNELCCAFYLGSTLDATAQIAIVEEWSAVHQRKTRQSVFLEQYPEADLSTGTVNICPNSLYEGKFDCARYQNCLSCKREFWSQEVE